MKNDAESAHFACVFDANQSCPPKNQVPGVDAEHSKRDINENKKMCPGSFVKYGFLHF